MSEHTFSGDIAEIERRLSVGGESRNKLIGQLQTLEAELQFLQRNLGYARAAQKLGGDNAEVDNEEG